ncbi:hypothetical protein ACKWTF_006696 [Chironomus riparius]
MSRNHSLSNIAECRRELKRTDSSSTVSSSVAAADISRQIENLRNTTASEPKIQSTSPGNIQVENVESFNIVYHNNFSSYITSDESRTNTKVSKSTLCLKRIKTFWNSIKCHCLVKRKCVKKITIIFISVIISTIFGLVVFCFFMKTFIFLDATTTVEYEPSETSTIYSNFKPNATTTSGYEPPNSTPSEYNTSIALMTICLVVLKTIFYF